MHERLELGSSEGWKNARSTVVRTLKIRCNACGIVTLTRQEDHCVVRVKEVRLQKSNGSPKRPFLTCEEDGCSHY